MRSFAVLSHVISRGAKLAGYRDGPTNQISGWGFNAARLETVRYKTSNKGHS